MKIRFHTNLDLAREAMPYNMGDGWQRVPRIGERIVFDVPGRPGRTYTLRVCDVTHSWDGQSVTVELHMPYDNESIRDWEERMKRHFRGE